MGAAEGTLAIALTDRKWKWFCAVVGGASVVGTVVIWQAYVAPLDSYVLTDEHEPDWINGSILAVMVGGGFMLVAAFVEPHRLWLVALSAIVPPLVVTAVAVAYNDELRWQREARDVFTRYTHRFPDDELGDPGVREQVENDLTVCADQRAHRPTAFCVEMNVLAPEGQEVRGGFRYHPDETAEYGFISARPFDCFGRAIMCEGLEEP